MIEPVRCSWPTASETYLAYHDREWGRPTTSEHRLFEKICLEGFQSGLSWLTILMKRPRFRKVFADFDYRAVAEFSSDDVERLLQDAGIVRHRGKIESTINNAQRAVERGWHSYTDRSVGGVGQRVEAPRLEVLRADDGLCVHAIRSADKRSRRHLLCPPGMPRRTAGLPCWAYVTDVTGASSIR